MCTVRTKRLRDSAAVMRLRNVQRGWCGTKYYDIENEQWFTYSWFEDSNKTRSRAHAQRDRATVCAAMLQHVVGRACGHRQAALCDAAHA